MVHDIETMKSLGFTMLRKHAKIEPLRWYAHCDRLGMLVWQDMVNGGGRYRDLTTTRPARHPVAGSRDRLHRLFGRAGRGRPRGVPPRGARDRRAAAQHGRRVAVWTPFNEGWGQFDAARSRAGSPTLDPTRQVNHASGWVDQGGGDVRELPRLPAAVPDARARRWADLAARPRVVALTEYGGYSLRVEGHDWSPREFGYRHFDDADVARPRRSSSCTRRSPTPYADGLGATVYTQLSDVEDELNGLLTWDRDGPQARCRRRTRDTVTARLHP